MSTYLSTTTILNFDENIHHVLKIITIRKYLVSSTLNRTFDMVTVINLLQITSICINHSIFNRKIIFFIFYMNLQHVKSEIVLNF